jgi:hypothetical protein
MNNQAHRKVWWSRWPRWLWWVVGGIVGLVVLIVLVTTIYVHTVTAPAMLVLPRVTKSSSNGAAIDGVWNVGPGSIVGWRVQQVILGQQSPLVGRTNKVWGSLTVAGGLVTQGSFTADMASLTSSLSQTTRRTVFDMSTYPTVRLVLTDPIALGPVPTDGTVERFPAVGNLTLHGVSHVVPFSAAAERSDSNVYVLADITFPYGNWRISAAGVPFLADLQSPATIEVLLHLTQGPGNPPSVPSPAALRAGRF